MNDDDLQDLSDIDLADIDDDLSDMEFNDSEDEEAVDDELISSLNKKLNVKGSKSKEKKKGIDNDLFVSTEKFNGSEGEEFIDDELISSLNKKLNAKGPKSKKKKKGIDNNIFVSAEKFAEMLEEQNKTKGKHGGSNVFSSSDGASSKQIDWETKRHQRLKGSFDKKRKSVQSFNYNRVKRLKR